MPAAEVDGLSINYEVFGSGPPVLLIHGLGSSVGDWERQVERFEGSWALIAVDLRGHGESDKPPGPYEMADFANDAACVLDRLEVGTAPVVGLSLGGMVGFQLAADRPDLVDRLMSVNAVQALEFNGFRKKAQVAQRKLVIRFGGMERVGKVLARRLFPDMAAEQELMVERWKRNDKIAYTASLQAALDWPGVVDEMARFDKPITVVASDQDDTPLEDTRRYVDLMPSAEMIVIEGAGHAVPVERPEAFNRVLADFLG